MEEIKFRVWDEFTKKMYYEVELMKKEDGYWWIWENGCLLNGSESSRRFVMQYINHTDKNNKDIYQGDLLKISMQREVQNNLLPVEDLYSFYEKWFCGDPYYQITELEIVGNKFENKELLK